MTVSAKKSGILLIDKPAGMTSHDVVAVVRKMYSTKQAGHTGTLDPMATGLLVVLVGSAVKASEYLVSDKKSYRAGLRLGVTTDTEDTEGKIISTSDSLPEPCALEDCLTEFRGQIYQTPPMYSAIKVGGKKLVDLARQGVEIERESRAVFIDSLELCGRCGGDYLLDICCSKGTYIRTLCADIGKKLGCGGAMSSLRRTACGAFSLKDAFGLDELKTYGKKERTDALIPLEKAFESLPAVYFPAFYERLAKNGCEIYQKKIGTGYKSGARLRVCDAQGFFALAEVRDYPGGSAIKLIKRFD